MQNKKKGIEYIEVKNEDHNPYIKIKTQTSLFKIELDSVTNEFDLFDKSNTLIDSFSTIDKAYNKIDQNA